MNYSDSAGDSETSSDSDSSSLSVPSSPDNVSATLPSVEPHPQFYENTPHSGSALSTPPNRFHSGDRYMLSSIDDLVFENDAYWNEKIKDELRVLELPRCLS